MSARFAANGPGAVISVAVLDGTRRRDILHVDAMPERIDWSPDGHRLVFDGAGLHTVNVDGRGYQLIPGTDSAWKHPAWSPDGKRIVATRLTCPCTEASRPNELLTVNADGSGQHVIVNDAHGVSWPGWQPAIPPSAPR